VGVALCGGLTRVSASGARMTRERLGCAGQEERGMWQTSSGKAKAAWPACILAGCQSAAGLVLS